MNRSTREPGNQHGHSPAPANRRTVVVTGASAGIGAAFAEVFAAERWDLVLIARREDRLLALADRLRTTYGVETHVIVADLADRQSCRRIVSDLQALRVQVDALVNNAGYGVPGSYLRSPWERHDAMLQVMVTAVAELTYLLLPGMIDRRFGRIINVASLAGLVPTPGGHTLYAATKAWVIKFSEALGHEVRRDGVQVTALCPGFTYSEFHDVIGTRQQMQDLPSWMWLDAPTVARQGYEAVMGGIPLYINGRVNRTIAVLVRFAPQWLIRSVERRIGHRKLD
jgi:short-subunit dehydrogenase